MDELKALSLEDSTSNRGANPPGSEEIAKDEQEPQSRKTKACLGMRKKKEGGDRGPKRIWGKPEYSQTKSYLARIKTFLTTTNVRLKNFHLLWSQNTNIIFQAQWKIVDTPHFANGLPFRQTKRVWNPENVVSWRGKGQKGCRDKVTNALFESYEDKANALWSLNAKGRMPQEDRDQSAKRIQCRSKEHSIFHPFPRLPQEIRLKIWKFTLPDPQVVFLSFEGSPD